MTPLAAGLAGLAGAGAIEISELYGAIRFIKDFPWRHPEEAPLGPYLLSVVLRLLLGAIVAALCAIAGPLGAVGAVAAGIAAPKLLEELGRHGSLAGAHAVAASQASAWGAGGLVPKLASPALPQRPPAVPGEAEAANGPR
jgi:hypothetical protein